MIQQLFNQYVIAFREGIEASLIIMTVMIALRQRKATKLIRAAWAGIIAAIVACTAGGIALGTIALVNNHGVELILYCAAAVTVLSMVFWMMRTGKKLRTGIEHKIDEYHQRSGILPQLGIFAFVFFMISREGFEMVLLLLAFGSGIGGHYYVTSMLLGLASAVAVSMLLSRGLLRFNLGKFLQYTAVVLIIFVVQLVFDVMHEAIEGNFIAAPQNQAFSNFIDYAHDQVPIFSYLGLALFLGLMIYFSLQAVNSKRALRAALDHKPANV